MRVAAAAVVFAKVVVVPCSEDGLVLQALEKAAIFEQGVLFLHHWDATFVCINIVPHEDEKIARQGERAVEHGVLVCVEAGAEDDVLQWGLFGSMGCGQTDGWQGGEEMTAGGKRRHNVDAGVPDQAMRPWMSMR